MLRAFRALALTHLVACGGAVDAGNGPRPDAEPPGDAAVDGGAAPTADAWAPVPDAGCAPSALPPAGWARAFGSKDREQAEGVALDECGNLSIVGSFNGTIDFGGGAFTSTDPVVTAGDLFVASFDANGKHRWSRDLGQGDGNAWRYITADPGGNVIVAGSFTGDADFGGGPVTADVIESDVFIAKYTTDGQHLWSHTYGDAYDSDKSSGVSAAPDGSILVAGNFAGTITFGSQTLSGNSSGVFPRDLAQRQQA